MPTSHNRSNSDDARAQARYVALDGKEMRGGVKPRDHAALDLALAPMPVEQGPMS